LKKRILGLVSTLLLTLGMVATASAQIVDPDAGFKASPPPQPGFDQGPHMYVGGNPFEVHRYTREQLQAANYKYVTFRDLSNGSSTRRNDVLAELVPLPENWDLSSEGAIHNTLDLLLGRVMLTPASYDFPLLMLRPGGYKRTAIPAIFTDETGREQQSRCYGRLSGWKVNSLPGRSEVTFDLVYVAHEKCVNQAKGAWHYYYTFTVTTPTRVVQLQGDTQYVDRQVNVPVPYLVFVDRPAPPPVMISAPTFIYTAVTGNGTVVTSGVTRTTVITGSIGLWITPPQSLNQQQQIVCPGGPPGLPTVPVTYPKAPSTPPNPPEDPRPDPVVPNPGPQGNGPPGPGNGGTPITTPVTRSG